MADIVVTSDWQALSVLSGFPVGTQVKLQNKGTVNSWFIESTTEPSEDSTEGELITSIVGSEPSKSISSGTEEVWLRTSKGYEATLFVQESSSSGGGTGGEPAPEGLYEGTRAMTVQGYEESNIKLGLQFEASKNFGDIPTGGVLDSIIRTGSTPVSLKKRSVSFTGEGLQGEIFINPTFTGGNIETYQNATTISPNIGSAQILTGITLQDEGTLVFAPVYAFGNTSNQGKGGLLTLMEPEHILAPNTDFLFRLTSLDSSTQKIASHLTWYEGELDLPRP